MSMNYHRPDECRAALMLVVDAMRAEGWRFEFEDAESIPEFMVRASLWPDDKASPTVHMSSNPDEVTALAECLIAALGEKE